MSYSAKLTWDINSTCIKKLQFKLRVVNTFPKWGVPITYVAINYVPPIGIAIEINIHTNIHVSLINKYRVILYWLSSILYLSHCSYL